MDFLFISNHNNDEILLEDLSKIYLKVNNKYTNTMVGQYNAIVNWDNEPGYHQTDEHKNDGVDFEKNKVNRTERGNIIKTEPY